MISEFPAIIIGAFKICWDCYAILTSLSGPPIEASDVDASTYRFWLIAKVKKCF